VKIVSPEPDGPEIGVFNVNGDFFALRNYCPHMGAPVCRGHITGTTASPSEGAAAQSTEWIMDGEIIACPWHRWEFEIRTGRTVFPSRSRIRRYTTSVVPDKRVERYPVVVEEGTVILHLDRR
jgi:nitrite reductase/ring-hydroxylating ferredoxin subunit